MKNYDIATRAIHAGQEPDPSTGAIMTPIYATSTYVQESPGKHKGYDYARSINPTRLAYEKIIDLEAIAKIAREKKIISVSDNTFATPWLQRPLEAGFDMVVHSATKYLNGHSDMVGGVIVVGENKELADQIAFLQNSVGAIAGPFDSLLAMRGLKTLALRMERHCSNALEIARWLEEQPQVKSVHYPGLKTHPQHNLARQQMRGFGGIVTIILKTDLEGTRRFLENTHLFALAESLGGVESLIDHPAIMTHASVPKDQREKLGISDSLVRLSVGVEGVRDLIDDLQFAFEAI